MLSGYLHLNIKKKGINDDTGYARYTKYRSTYMLHKTMMRYLIRTNNTCYATHVH